MLLKRIAKGSEMKHSAGVLAYRRRPHGPEVFLVHPGGPYWRNKDIHAWSIPKGEFEDEEPLTAAKREFLEETGQQINGEFLPLPPLAGPRKVIHAFLVESENLDPERIVSNTFPLQWPPKSGRIQHFPEVDAAAWFSLDEARKKLHKHQLPLLDVLEQHFAGSP